MMRFIFVVREEESKVEEQWQSQVVEIDYSDLLY
jgi:hypothetical protein